MSPRETNTPGFFGYVCAFAIGLALYAGIVHLTSPDPGDVDALGAFFALAFVGTVYFLGIPVLVVLLVVGAVLVWCRSYEDQRVHVFAAGATAWAFSWLLAVAIDRPGQKAVAVIGLPLAMALGRAAVIPIVRGRRELAEKR